jgi:hypothetical protein
MVMTSMYYKPLRPTNYSTHTMGIPPCIYHVHDVQSHELRDLARSSSNFLCSIVT